MITALIPASLEDDEAGRRKFRGVRGKAAGRWRRRTGYAANTRKGRYMRKLAGNVAKNSRSISSIAKKIAKIADAIGGTTVPATGSANGSRPLLGGTLAAAAPAAAGMAAWAGLAITPSADAHASYLVVEVYEDTYAAVAAGNTLIPGKAAFDVTLLTVGGSNLIVSNAAFVPGGIFSVAGRFYGYPFAAGRLVKVGSGSNLNINGRISPRAPAGASAFDVTAAFLAPSMAA